MSANILKRGNIFIAKVNGYTQLIVITKTCKNGKIITARGHKNQIKDEWTESELNYAISQVL